MSAHRILVMNFTAKSAVVKRRLVEMAADNQVQHATSGTDVVVGVVDELDAAANARVDVIVAGAPSVEAGGTIAAGERVMAGSDGKAVKWTSNNTVAGVALEAAASGEMFQIILK